MTNGELTSQHCPPSLSPLRAWGNLLLDVFPSMLFDTMQSDISLRQGMPPRHLLVRILHQETPRYDFTYI